jgi:hypothetical protein
LFFGEVRDDPFDLFEPAGTGGDRSVRIPGGFRASVGDAKSDVRCALLGDSSVFGLQRRTLTTIRSCIRSVEAGITTGYP